MRMLIAEDEPRVAAAIARGLRRHGAAVDVAADGAQALATRACTRTTSSCSTATCPRSTATTCAGRSTPSSPRRRS